MRRHVLTIPENRNWAIYGHELPLIVPLSNADSHLRKPCHRFCKGILKN